MTGQADPVPMPVMWRGEDAHGANRTGCATPDDLQAWTETRFRRGWRWLTARSHDVTVAEIGVRNGERIWWAEVTR